MIQKAIGSIKDIEEKIEQALDMNTGFLDFTQMKLANRTERQKMGFCFEDLSLGLLNSASENSGYTSTHDGLLHDVPISVKTVSPSGEICFADYSRHLGMNEDFIIFSVGTVYKKNLRKVNTLILPGAEWRATFSDEVCQKYLHALRSVTNEYSDDPLWKELRTESRDFEKELVRTGVISGNVLARPKRDHKKQRRLQAAIPRVNFNRMVDQYSSQHDEFLSDALVQNWKEAKKQGLIF